MKSLTMLNLKLRKSNWNSQPFCAEVEVRYLLANSPIVMNVNSVLFLPHEYEEVFYFISCDFSYYGRLQ